MAKEIYVVMGIDKAVIDSVATYFEWAESMFETRETAEAHKAYLEQKKHAKSVSYRIDAHVLHS